MSSKARTHYLCRYGVSCCLLAYKLQANVSTSIVENPKYSRSRLPQTDIPDGSQSCVCVKISQEANAALAAPLTVHQLCHSKPSARTVTTCSSPRHSCTRLVPGIGRRRSPIKGPARPWYLGRECIQRAAHCGLDAAMGQFLDAIADPQLMIPAAGVQQNRSALDEVRYQMRRGYSGPLMRRTGAVSPNSASVCWPNIWAQHPRMWRAP